MLRRSLAILAVLLVAAGCTQQAKADDVDRQRIAAMKSEPIVAGLNGTAHEGAGDGGDYSVNSYSAYPVSAVAAATVVAARGQAAAVLGRLRSQGWTVISARCTVPAPGSYTWEAFAFKVRDQVPYAAQMTASYSRDSGLSVNVTQQAPFHADTKPRFQPAPAALASGTCVEQGDVEHPDAAQGMTWSLLG